MSESVELKRGLSARAALMVNVIDMVGVGPFVTLPLIVAAMGGPQAMLGWLLGAALSLCDGMTWSELGTAYPEAGGSYAYLKNLYGPRWGRGFSFLYAWQLLFSAPLSIASGCIGLSQYASYFLPNSGKDLVRFSLVGVPVVLSGQTLIAMGACLLAVVLLYRKIAVIDRFAKWLGLAVIGALVIVIVAGLSHFHASLAFDFPAGAFHLDNAFFGGLGAGLLVAAYDYWGYYNICFLGGEVVEPRRNIPRAVLGAITIVGTLYLLMNISVLGVIPWREIAGTAASGTRMYTMATLIERTVGHSAAAGMVVLIAIASFASVLALLLGYSRIPYAASRDGNFPAMFSKVHKKHHIPHVSLLTLAGVTLLCCLFRLQEVITTLVVIRILFQFLLQGVAVLLPRHRAQRKHGAFKMPLYPLPVLLAMGGFLFILFSRPNVWKELRTAGVILLAGLLIFSLRLLKKEPQQQV